MRWTLAAIFSALLLATPATAGSGQGQMSKGMQQFLDGMMKEIMPLMDGMKESMNDALPRLRQLLGMIGDFQNYEAPEMLPNGDIIIRRKTPLKPAPPAEGQTDL